MNKCLTYFSAAVIAFFSFSGRAQTHQCFSIHSNIHQKTTRFYEEPQFIQKMKELGYKIAPDPEVGALTLYKKMGDQWVSFGEVSEKEVKYSFHWSSKSAHENWIGEGRISPTEMDEILAAPGQTLGKGFYISTQPVDSRLYGEDLTIFENRRPMHFLSSIANPKNIFGDNETLVKELKDLGFDAYSADRYVSWISVINPDFLAKAHEVDHDIFQYILKHFKDDYNTTHMPVEENFSVIFQEKRAAFTETQFARSVAEKARKGLPLDATENKLFQLMSK